MGGCFSDKKGAKEAVGGVNQKATNNNNDAVDFFYTSQGFKPLFTQIEVRTYNFLIFHHFHTKFCFYRHFNLIKNADY